MWDVESGQLVRTFAFSGAIKNVALSFDWDHLQVLFSIPEFQDIFWQFGLPLKHWRHHRRCLLASTLTIEDLGLRFQGLLFKV